MVKKKTAKKAVHKKHDSAKVAEKIDDESPLIKMNQSTVITVVISLLVGLIIGALIVNAMLAVPVENDAETCTVDFIGGDNTAKMNVENYLNDNLRQPDMLAEGLSFVLEDSNNLSDNTFGYEVLVTDSNGLTQPAGAIVYVSGEKFVIAQSLPININEPIEPLVTQ